jgi:hypothetical protein
MNRGFNGVASLRVLHLIHLLCFLTVKDATRINNPRVVEFELHCYGYPNYMRWGLGLHNPAAQGLMVAKASAMRGGAFGRAYIRFM